MKCRTNLLAILCALIITSSGASAQSIAIVGGTVIDGNGGTPIEDGVILIEDKRIIAIGGKSTAVPPQARRITVEGKYVIPGLMDANVHLVLDGSPYALVRYEGKYDELAIEAAQVALRSGLTTVFDSWGPREYLVKARNAINEGRVTASRVYLAGNIVGLGGPFSRDFDLSFPLGREALLENFADRIDAIWQENVGPELVLMSPEQVRQEIRKYVQKGVDFVKYAVNIHRAGAPFIQFSPRVQQVIVEEAHRAGITVQTHTTSGEGLHLAIQAGVDLLQHCEASSQPIPAELIAQRRIPCAILPNTAKAVASSAPFHEKAVSLHEKAPAWMLGAPKLPPALKQQMASIDDNRRALLRAGAVVLLSTDGGIFCSNTFNSFWWKSWNAPEENRHMLGEGHFQWLLAVEQMGMKPMDALMAATSNIARAYKVDKDLGTLEKGKIADLLILDRNPLESAVNYRSISLIMKEGRVIDRDSLPKAAGRVAGC